MDPREFQFTFYGLMIVGFSIYSYVDAWSSVTDYNEDLAARLRVMISDDVQPEAR
jgi:hypothetical protein